MYSIYRIYKSEEDGFLRIVPHTWVVKANVGKGREHVFWPPYSDSVNAKLVNENASPDPNSWHTYRAVKLHTSSKLTILYFTRTSECT